MSHISEQDLQLLETYVDDEISADEESRLRQRLDEEPALAAALQRLHDERAWRHDVFYSVEREALRCGDEQMGARIATALNAQATREMIWTRRLRILRQVSAAAACIVVGLCVGWFARDRISAVAPTAKPPAAAPIQSPGIRYTANPNVTFISGQFPRGGGFNVLITDDAGRVLSERHFDSLNEARDFSGDLTRFQNGRGHGRNGVRFIGDDY